MININNKKLFEKLGNIIELPINLILYHSSNKKFMYPNKIANWFTPLYSDDMKNSIIKNKLHKHPFWEGNIIDYKYKLIKKINILDFNTKNKNNKNLYLPNIIKNFTKSKNFDSIKNRYISNTENNKYLENYKNDYEYELTYWMCKYTNIKGWIEDIGYCGYFMLCGDTSNILELVQVIVREKNQEKIKYYNQTEWYDFLNNNNNTLPPLIPIINQKIYTNLKITNRKKYDDILTKIYLKVLDKNTDLLKNQEKFDKIFISIYVNPIIRSLKNTKYIITEQKINEISEYIKLSIEENFYNYNYNKNITNILKTKYKIDNIN